MQWIICIGMIPVRFYHGDSLEMPERYSKAPGTERLLHQALLDLHPGVRDGVLLRIATVTDSSGVPLKVELVEYEEASDTVLHTFTIPEASEGGGIVDLPKAPPKPPVIVPKPAVRPLTGRAKGRRAKGQGGDGDSGK